MINMNPRTTMIKPKSADSSLQVISQVALPRITEDALTLHVQARCQKTETFPIKDSFARPILNSKPKWKDAEYRQAYMESAVHQTIAWQIRLNRERRGMTQAELAKKTGTRQSAISRAEDTEYEGHSLSALVKIANAFDCALVVNFVSYSELAYQSNRLGKNYMIAIGYQEETNAQPAAEELSNDTCIHALR